MKLTGHSLAVTEGGLRLRHLSSSAGAGAPAGDSLALNVFTPPTSSSRPRLGPTLIKFMITLHHEFALPRLPLPPIAIILQGQTGFEPLLASSASAFQNAG